MEKRNDSIDELEKEEAVVMKDEAQEEEVPALSLKRQFSTKKGRVRFITRVAMMGALSFVFYEYLKFPLPAIFPGFLEVKFSFLFVILSGLLTGPVGGILTILIMILPGVFQSWTFGVGELTDFVAYSFIVISSSLIYMFKHTKKGGIIAIVVAYIVWVTTYLLINWLISMPFYINAYLGHKGTIDSFVSTYLKPVLKNATTENYMAVYLFGACLPFNLLLGFVNCGLGVLVYKRISIILRKIGI